MAKEKLGIVVSEFNSEITNRMEKAAVGHAGKQGAEIACVVKVPGAYEIPFAAKKLLSRKDIGAAVALGAVIKGDTDHDIIIGHSVAKSLQELSLEFDKPVSLGIIGPNATWEHAEKRAEEYSRRAVDATLKMLRLFKKVH